MESRRKNEQDQVALWNGPAGRAWVEAQGLLDRMFQPMEQRLVEEVAPDGGVRVLDVGCGTGATTIAVARRLGERGRCVGIDLSAPMIEAARARALQERTPPTFLQGDAQTHPFAPASFDRIQSRFGVMFFDDPIGAFANLRRAADDGAGLCLIVWRDAAENAFMTTAERAVTPLLPNLPPRRPDAPGQFAFADPRRVESILAASGWAEPRIDPIDFSCVMSEAELPFYLTRLGPVGRALDGVDDETRRQILQTLSAAFAPFVQGAEVRFTAACWMIRARAVTG